MACESLDPPLGLARAATGPVLLPTPHWLWTYCTGPLASCYSTVFRLSMSFQISYVSDRKIHPFGLLIRIQITTHQN